MSENSYNGGEKHYDYMRPWPERAHCSSMEVSHFLWIFAVVVLLGVVFVLTAVIVRLMNKGKEGRVIQSGECTKEATYDDVVVHEKVDNENNLKTIWTSGAPDLDCTGVVYDELPEISAKREGPKEEVVYHELPDFITLESEGRVYFDDEGNRV